MQTILLVVIIILLIVVVILFLKNKKPQDDTNTTSFQLLFSHLNELTKTIDYKMSESRKEVTDSMRYQTKETGKMIEDITTKLVRLDETNKQVIGFTDQLQNLQDILKNPKQRGILGEYYLESLLRNVMPPGSYETQYRLGKNDNGEELVPDAVVFVREKIIPIDSKFSLENYNRIIEEKNPAEKERLEKLFESDLKNRIVETSKYIRPELNTMDFAFMFIPHEAIYYDLLIGRVGKGEDENLIQRAANKYKVIIVSPTSFLAYLQTVLQGLNAMKIEKEAVDIIKRVGELGKHLKSYEEYHGKLGNALGTVINHYNSTSKELKKVDKDVLRIAGTSPGIEIDLLEKPNFDE